MRPGQTVNLTSKTHSDHQNTSYRSQNQLVQTRTLETVLSQKANSHSEHTDLKTPTGSITEIMNFYLWSWVGFQLKLQSAVFGMIIISFYCKYSAKTLQKCSNHILFSFCFECVFHSVLAFEKCAADMKCFAGGGVWMRKVFMDFWNCAHWMHFVWKHWKIIHSLVHTDFSFADSVKSFDNVTSVLTDAC